MTFGDAGAAVLEVRFGQAWKRKLGSSIMFQETFLSIPVNYPSVSLSQDMAGPQPAGQDSVTAHSRLGDGIIIVSVTRARPHNINKSSNTQFRGQTFRGLSVPIVLRACAEDFEIGWLHHIARMAKITLQPGYVD